MALNLNRALFNYVHCAKRICHFTASINARATFTSHRERFRLLGVFANVISLRIWTSQQNRTKPFHINS